MRNSAPTRVLEFAAEDRARDLVVRAFKLRRRGEHRRATLTLREACGLDHRNAAHWMIYGSYLATLGRRDDAEHAMKQSLYLREREGAKAKAKVVRGQLLRLARAASSQR